MVVYLASFKTIENRYTKSTKDISLLSSFWEHNGRKFGDYVLQEKHILDSGAFTAINDKSGKYKNFDWDNYVKKYIEFIKTTNQKLFFELDIDCVVGLQKVEYYRNKIADAIGIAPIVVWHSSRGIDYFRKCCNDYPYVALSLTSKSPSGKYFRSNLGAIKWFIDYAHESNCKIHGLGFTNIEWLYKLPFDSVDSTSWINARFGAYSTYRNGIMIKITNPDKKTYLLNNSRCRMNIYSFDEWVKFQKYAEKNL